MPAQPNLIFIITDDQGYGDIGAHGNPRLRTPWLDRMARESVRLDDHHHDPLCSPSRAALLTGQYAARNGVSHVIHGCHLLHPRARTMANIFAANGYRAGMFGKWHLGDNYPFAPRFRGFDEVLCHRGGGVGELPDYWGNNYFDDAYFRNGVPERCRGYCTDVFFAAALDFIERNRDAPFFVYLAPNAMHSPHIAPEADAAPYIAAGIPQPRANFYGMISNFDDNLGRLFARLRQLELEADTIVAFTSDHGTAAGWNGVTGGGFNAGQRGKKGSLYDGGHRVPFFLRWRDRLPAGHRIGELTAHIDILPTVMDLCGLRCDSPRELDGLSLAPMMRGEQDRLPERALVVQLLTDAPEPWRDSVVLRGRWRLVNGSELYDIRADPAQEQDLSATRVARKRLLRQDYLRRWSEIAPGLSRQIAIPVGTSHENPTLLSARDWHPTQGRTPWMQSWIDHRAYDAKGYWRIDVERAGRYRIALRDRPHEAGPRVNASRAVLRIDDREYAWACASDDEAPVFELELEGGLKRLSAELESVDPPRSRGAYYVYVRRL